MLLKIITDINNKVNKQDYSNIGNLKVKICPPKVTRLGTARPIFEESTFMEDIEELQNVYKYGKRGYYP
jgi:hypothetical protein